MISGVVENENTIAFDVDETMILHKQPVDSNTITIDYYGQQIFVKKHTKHIEFMKACKARGFFIILWSNNGFRHAQVVRDALGLQDIVDLCMTKFQKVVDDQRVDKFIKTIYIPEN